MRSKTPLIVAVIAILLGMVALNVTAQRFTPGHEHEEEETAQTQGGAAPPPQTSEQTGDPAQLSPDQTVGPSSAKNTIVFGWEWTPEVQANPAKMVQAVDALRKAAGNARLRIVNVDAVPDAPRGLVVNNKTILELPPSGVPATDHLMQSLGAALARP